MPVHIKRLRCRVTVRVKNGGAILHAPERPVKPSLDYTLPPVEARSEAARPEPAQLATEKGQGAAVEAPTAPVRRADAGAVANRVYELMTQEIAQARSRGGIGRKG